MNTYHAQITREDGFWVAEVDGVGATEARKLSLLEVEVRDLISGLLDVNDDSFGVRFDFDTRFPPAVGKTLRAFNDSRDRLASAEALFERDRLVVALELKAADVSLRDAAVLLGISFQRVQQLTAGHG